MNNQQSRFLSVHVWSGAIAAAAVIALLLGSRESAAQNGAAPSYKQIPFGANLQQPAAQGAARNKAMQIASGLAPLAGNEAALNEYFNGVFFPQFTQITAQGSTNNLSKARDMLKNSFTRPGSKIPVVNAALHKILLTKMAEIAIDNYHPVSRYNAVVVISDLNVKELGPGEKGPAEPVAEALLVLLKILQDEGTPESVKIGALVGLKRHAEFMATPAGQARAEQKPQITSAVRKFIDQQAAPPGRSEETHRWIRQRAADVLAKLGDTSPEVQAILAPAGKAASSAQAAAPAGQAAPQDLPDFGAGLGSAPVNR